MTTLATSDALAVIDRDAWFSIGLALDLHDMSKSNPDVWLDVIDRFATHRERRRRRLLNGQAR